MRFALCIALFVSSSAMAHELSGDWRSPGCIDGDSPQDIHIDRSTFFDNGTGRFRYSNAFGQRCASLDLDFFANFDYVTGEPQQGITPIDLTFTGVTLTPLTDAVADAFNARSVCGYSDWAAGVLRDVSGMACNGIAMQAVGSHIYDIYQIEEASYFHGLHVGLKFDQDGTTPNNRPTTLDDRIIGLRPLR